MSLERSRGTQDPPYGLALKSQCVEGGGRQWPRAFAENLLKVNTHRFCLPDPDVNAQHGVENLSANHSLHFRERARAGKARSLLVAALSRGSPRLHTVIQHLHQDL